MPIALWVAWSDMAFMKIPNRAVIALVLVYALVGPLALPAEAYLWQWVHLPVVLAVGFALNMARLIGAGDAKFAAAAAPFVAAGDGTAMLYLLATVTAVALACHRAVRATPRLRAPVGHWESWHRRDFPMGLALAGALVIYLAAGVAAGG